MKTPITNVIILVIMFSLMLFFIAKTQSLVFDNTCSPPCWINITPDITTRNETLDILFSQPKINPRSIQVRSNNQEDDTIIWLSYTQIRDFGGEITFLDDKVYVLEFIPIKGRLLLSEILKYFGEPEAILAGYESVERPGLSIYILYPSKGIALLIHQRPYFEEWAEIKPDSSIYAVWFFDSSRFDEVIRHGPINRFSEKVIKQGLIPWPGYSKVELINLLR